MESGEELFGSIYQRGDVIFQQGEVGDKMYIIQSGAVKVSHKQGERETFIAIREKGDFFGEMALFEEERRFATVTAICQTRLLPVTRASLLEKMQRDPSVALHLLKGLILRIQEADQEVKKMVEGDEILRFALGRSTRPSRRDAPALHALDTYALDTQTQPVRDARSSCVAPGTQSDDYPAGVSLHNLAAIWDVAESAKWYEPGENIFLEGQPGAEMYIVLAGSVEITQGSGQDKYTLQRVRPGEFFGEWALIVDNPRSTNAAAISRTQLLPVHRAEFAGQIKVQPELAVYLIQGLCARLRRVSAALANPRASLRVLRQDWQPLLRKHEPVKISIVSLATCAGCSAVLLDDEILAQVFELADILYCPMLIDQDNLQEADVALVDGAVRLKEDQEKLEEARRKSRLLVAWGTCAAFGGMPAEANRFELEEIIAETFGQAADPFAYYLSGERGVGQKTYQEQGVALLRKAGKLDDFVRVDYYAPGCPPSPALLLQLIAELTGMPGGKPQPVVCGQCARKPAKTAPASLTAFPKGAEDASTCYNSLGILCLGFLTNGGCEAVCPQNGLPCWGCRGPAKIALKKMADGDSFEEVVVQSVARRCQLPEDQARSLIKQLRKQGHGLFQFEPGFVSSLSRLR